MSTAVSSDPSATAAFTSISYQNRSQPLMRLEIKNVDARILAEIENRIMTDRIGLRIVCIKRSGPEIQCQLVTLPENDHKICVRGYLARLLEEYGIVLLTDV